MSNRTDMWGRDLPDSAEIDMSSTFDVEDRSKLKSRFSDHTTLNNNHQHGQHHRHYNNHHSNSRYYNNRNYDHSGHDDRNQNRQQYRNRDRGEYQEKYRSNHPRYEASYNEEHYPVEHHYDHSEYNIENNYVQAPYRKSKKPNAITPLLTFKNFLSTTSDEAVSTNPEIAQRKYEEYQVDYISNFSKSFFERNSHEEWFIERYDPLKQQQIEKDTCLWSIAENKHFYDLFHMKPVEDASDSMPINEQVLHHIVTKMRLEQTGQFSSNNAGKSIAGASVDQGPVEDASTAADDGLIVVNNSNSDVTVSVPPASSTADDIPSHIASDSGKYIPGHLDRTLYLTGIHANCPKQIVKDSIFSVVKILELEQEGSEDADAEVSPFLQQVKSHSVELGLDEDSDIYDLIVDRLLISQPTWTNRGKFERSGWLVLRNTKYVDEMLRLLKDLEIVVPGSVSPHTGEPAVDSYRFNITVNQHVTKSYKHNNSRGSSKIVPNINSDESAARRIAWYLDEERNIPNEYRLHSILSIVDPIIDASTGLEYVFFTTDVLDIAVNYLKRVHLIAFYECKRFIDEAHLLSINSSIALRDVRYYGHTNVDKRIKKHVGVAASDCDTENSMLNSDVNNGTFENRLVPNFEQRRIKTIPYLDRRLEAMLFDLHNKGYNKMLRLKVLNATGGDASAEEETNNNASSSKDVGEGAQSVSTDADMTSSNDNAMSEGTSAMPQTPSQDILKIPQDEQDALAIATAQEAALNAWSEELVVHEADGRARCGYAWCDKLFKAPEFVKKHLRSKHSALSMDIAIECSKPFMWERYNRDSIYARPLPSVPVETPYDVEYRTVKDILMRCANASNIHTVVKMAYQSPPPKQHSYVNSNSNRNDRDRNSHQGGDRNDRSDKKRTLSHSHSRGEGRSGGDNQRRHSSGGVGGSDEPDHSNPNSNPHSNPNRRILPMYTDVDAPQTVAVALDYGGVSLLPPPKKRKLSGKLLSNTNTPVKATEDA